MTLTLRFDRGTLRIDDLLPGVALPLALWDGRTACARAPAYAYGRLVARVAEGRLAVEDHVVLRRLGEREHVQRVGRVLRPGPEQVPPRVTEGISTKKVEDGARDNLAVLLDAPQPVVWKLCLRRGIAGVLAALGTGSLDAFDAAWDSAQRRLYHRAAVGVDDSDKAVRDAADRLSAGLFLGNGTGQTHLDYDAEYDFGCNQLALTRAGGSLAADAKKLNLGDALADVDKTTAALGKALGRDAGSKRKASSRRLRDAVAACARAFNGVQDSIAWFMDGTKPGPERDRLAALQAPLDALLARHASAAAAPAAPADGPAAPADPADPAKPA